MKRNQPKRYPDFVLLVHRDAERARTKLAEAIKTHEGKMRPVAQALGVSHTTLYAYLDMFQLHPAVAQAREVRRG